MRGDAGRCSGELAEIQASPIARLVDRDREPISPYTSLYLPISPYISSLVDRDRLLERLAGGSRLRRALGASEVDEVDLGAGARGLAVRLRELLDLGRYREM